MRFALGVLIAAVLAAPALAAKPTVSPADRAAINQVLDAFVPAAINRVHSERAWALTTKSMHRGTSIAEWRQGLLPVQPFPVVGKEFHGWTIDDVGPNRAEIVLLVHLKKGNDLGLGGASFDIGMRKIGGRWLVDSSVVAATFAATGTPSKILAAADFGAGSAPDPYAKNEGLHSQISTTWIWAIPAGLLLVIVVGPLGILIHHRRRDGKRLAEGREEIRARVFRTQA